MNAYEQGVRDSLADQLAEALEQRDEARAERDHAQYLCERARCTAQRFEEELALIRRAAAARRHG